MPYFFAWISHKTLLSWWQVYRTTKREMTRALYTNNTNNADIQVFLKDYHNEKDA
ncbi:hypothetical protein BH23BAC2_BH23BAC2_19000 [soil metagenome]